MTREDLEFLTIFLRFSDDVRVILPVFPGSRRLWGDSGKVMTRLPSQGCAMGDAEEKFAEVEKRASEKREERRQRRGRGRKKGRRNKNTQEGKGRVGRGRGRVCVFVRRMN